MAQGIERAKSVNGHGPARYTGALSLDSVAQPKRTSLCLPTEIPLETWKRLGRQIFLISDSSAWWLGDWLVYGQEKFPDRYKRAVAESALDYQTLRNYAWVCRRFSVSRRRDTLSFQHHAEVASLAPPSQDSWLNRAEEAGWSRNELRKQLRADHSIERQSPEVTYIQVNIPPDRKEYWQAAADQERRCLLEWITATLDQAANAAFERTR